LPKTEITTSSIQTSRALLSCQGCIKRPCAAEKLTHTPLQNNAQITMEETVARMLEGSCLPGVMKTLG